MLVFFLHFGMISFWVFPDKKFYFQSRGWSNDQFRQLADLQRNFLFQQQSDAKFP